MNYCVNCGSPLPPDQESRTCSMCYGDPDHGKDGYYRAQLEREREEREFVREVESYETRLYRREQNEGITEFD